MKEFDFEELDRAVSSLMDQANQSQASPSSTPAQTPESEPKPEPKPEATEPVVSAPPLSTPVSTPASIRSVDSAPKPAKPAPTVTQRRGTVIDGFHRVAQPPVAQRSSRVGKTLQPSGEAAKPVGAQINDIVPSPANTGASTAVEAAEPPTEPIVEEPKVEKPATVKSPDIDRPAPVEPTLQTPPVVEKPAEETPEVDEPTVEAAPLPPSKPVDTSEVANSPFIPNTKVEKRPLGSKTETEAPADSQDVKAAIMPEELSNDLVSIEEAEATDNTEQSGMGGAMAQALAGGQAGASDQFKTPSFGPKTPEQGTIYSAEVAAQPLQHPAKQKSGIMRVVWIVLLLLVGAGGAVALYFSGIL